MELLLVGDRKMRPLSRLPHSKPAQNPRMPPFFSGKQFEIFAVPHPQVERKF
jgi:hypothetical protein